MNTKISCRCTQAKLKVEKQVQQFIIRIISVNAIIYFFWNLRIRIQLIYFKLKQRSLCFLVTGNANFRIQQISFTLLGFTQPHTAMPIIEDPQNNAKGFTSRSLWYFPKPVFCKFRENILEDDEHDDIEKFEENLGEFHVPNSFFLNVLVSLA